MVQPLLCSLLYLQLAILQTCISSPVKSSIADGYFLFPEEIKSNLVKLMSGRKLGSGDSAREASSLYSKMESDSDHEEMVIRDIFIRRLASLKFREGCAPAKQEILDNPPKSVGMGGALVNPKPELIHSWQLSLLRDKQPLCNFIHGLRCDSITKTCQCGVGASLEQGECRLLPGSNCGPDYDGPLEFNPLLGLKRLSLPPSPPCTSGALCQSRPLLFMSQCWCPEGKVCGGVKSDNVPLLPSLESLFTRVQSRFSLHFGDDCDPDAHSILLNPTGKNKTDYKQRISSIQQLLDGSQQTGFCTLSKFLNCSPLTRKCECFTPLVGQGGECLAPNRDSCQDSFSEGADFFQEDSKLSKIESVFATQFQPKCIPTAECDRIEGKCVCNNGRDGAGCDEERSQISPLLTTRNVAGHEKDKDINEAFYALNSYTLKIQPLLKLGYNDGCDVKTGEMSDRIFNFFHAIASSNPNIGGSKTMYQYQKVGKWMANLVRTGVTELCNGFQGLYCSPTKKCECAQDHIFETGSCRLSTGQECDPHPVTDWVASCRNTTACLPSVINFHHTCKCVTGCDDELEMTNATKVVLECEGEVENCDQLLVNVSEALPPQPEEIDPNSELEEKTELQEKLDKIKTNHRALEGSVCNGPLEQIFFINFPLFPEPLDFTNLTHLPKGLEHSRQVLEVIYSDKLRICDKSWHLTCQNDKCTCDAKCRDKQRSDMCAKEVGLTKVAGSEARLVASICQIIGMSKKFKKLRRVR